MLDDDEAVVLGQIEDEVMRTQLEKLSECLGLTRTKLRGSESIAHSKPAGLDAQLVERLRGALANGAAREAPEQGAAPEPLAEGEQEEVSPAAASSVRKVYGAALPPGFLEAAQPTAPIGPTVPDADEGDAEGDVEERDSPRVGPQEPSARDIEAKDRPGNAWWEREQARPVAPPPIEPPEAGAARDAWMTSLPADRASQSAETFGVSRTFLRNEKQQVDASAEWTQVPADAARAPIAAQPSNIPMSLAQVAALAAHTRANGGAQRLGIETPQSGKAEKRGPAPKSLVELHEEAQKKQKKAKAGKADWEESHPWKPFNRETDLDIRKEVTACTRIMFVFD